MSRAYEPTDEQVCRALDDLTEAEAGWSSTQPEDLMPHFVLGMIGSQLDSAAEAEAPTARAGHVRRARATFKAYQEWKARRRLDDDNGREPGGY